MLVVVIVLTALLLVGPIRLLGAHAAAAYDERPRPAWSLGPRVIGAGAVIAYLIEAGVVAARVRDGADLPVWLWVAHAVCAIGWWWLFVVRGRFSAAFTVACIDATLSLMLVGAFVAFGQPGAHLLWVSFAWLLVAAAAVFGIWQADGHVDDVPTG